MGRTNNKQKSFFAKLWFWIFPALLVTIALVPFYSVSLIRTNSVPDSHLTARQLADLPIEGNDSQAKDMQDELKRLRKEVKEKDNAAAKQRKQPRRQRAAVSLEEGGIRPLHVRVILPPRHDLLGAFALPQIFLLAITNRWGWEFEILPYKGSVGQKWLTEKFSQGARMAINDTTYGTGFQDANYNKGYDPVALNAHMHDYLGFFPEPPHQATKSNEMSVVKELPAPGTPELYDACRPKLFEGNGFLRCSLTLPHSKDTFPLQKHIKGNGGMDKFLTPSFRAYMHKR